MDRVEALEKRVAELEGKLRQTQALLDVLYANIDLDRHGPIAPAEPGPNLATVIRRLTVRQAEILSGVLERLSSDEIAERIDITANTVRTHLRYIYRKAEVKQRQELVDKFQAEWDQMDDAEFSRLTGGKGGALRYSEK